jgi:predicted ester cyclase
MAMGTPESNKDVIRQYVAAFNRGDIDALRDLFTPDAVIYGVLGSGGLDVAIPIWRELHAAFGIALAVEEIIAEGDRVAVRYTERGTFAGPFRGREPTGKAYELVAMEWFVLRDGLIHSRWGARDSAAQARQVGL